MDNTSRLESIDRQPPTPPPNPRTISHGRRSIPVAMPTQPQQNPMRTHTLPGELHQICAYVEATNTRIHYLEELLEPSAAAKITEINQGSRNTHRPLDSLERQIPFVSEMTREVWQLYKRLTDLEERCRGLEKGVDVKEWRKREAWVAKAPFVSREDGNEEDRSLKNEIPTDDKSSLQGGIHGFDENEEKSIKDGYSMSGGLPVEDKENSTIGEELPETPSSYPEYDWHGNGEDLVIPIRAKMLTNGCYKPNSAANVTKKENDTPSSTKTVHWSAEIARASQEVIDTMTDEERVRSVSLTDPDRKREGSAEGWIIAYSIMFGRFDHNLYVPHLAYIKIHEAKALKSWLIQKNHLRQSDGISRAEKLYHLLTLLHKGCRFESVAVCFSRTPKEIMSNCNEVFKGLLEMHSETMLPGRLGYAARKYLYQHLWRITGNFDIRKDEVTGRLYYPWAKEDIMAVLVTLNIYVGRYRKQGRFALDGPILNWGKYVELKEDERLENMIVQTEAGNLTRTVGSRRRDEAFEARFRLE